MLRVLDFIVLATIIFIAAICIKKTVSSQNDVIQVEAAGESYEYSLKKNGIYSVQGTIGITVFEIKDGKVRILESPCAGKNCVNQGWHTPLICLPNSVIISTENYGAFDAVSE